MFSSLANKEIIYFTYEIFDGEFETTEKSRPFFNLPSCKDHCKNYIARSCLSNALVRYSEKKKRFGDNTDMMTQMYLFLVGRKISDMVWKKDGYRTDEECKQQWEEDVLSFAEMASKETTIETLKREYSKFVSLIGVQIGQDEIQRLASLCKQNANKANIADDILNTHFGHDEFATEIYAHIFNATLMNFVQKGEVKIKTDMYS